MPRLAPNPLEHRETTSLSARARPRRNRDVCEFRFSRGLALKSRIVQFAVSTLLAVVVCQAPCQAGAAADAPDLASERGAAETKLKYFAEVDQGVYKGSKPSGDADYRFLQSLHVKY